MKEESKLTRFFYWIGELINIGTTTTLVWLIFFAPVTEANIRVTIFFLWVNINTHITGRTKKIEP